LLEVSTAEVAGKGFVFCVLSVGREHDAAASVTEIAMPQKKISRLRLIVDPPSN
jgi:hypothetical protein